MNLRKKLPDKRTLVAMALVLVAFLAIMGFLRRSSNGVAFQTVPVKRGDLLATISATGKRTQRDFRA